jgi:phosphoribosylaminoimidazole (AIR) synthetase
MGVGFVLVVDKINASKVLSQIPQAFELGVIKAGERSVEIA